MDKNELLNLLNIKNDYNINQYNIPFCISYTDRLLGTENAVYFIFNDKNTIKIIVETTEFSDSIQILELNLLFNNEIELDKHNQLKNELFLFLDFEKDLINSLLFLGNFITNLLINKFNLKSNLTFYEF